MQDLENFKYNLRSLQKCRQYWDDMQPVKGGRLCESCNKKIIDFSKMTNIEIAFFMAEKKGPVCGYYLPGQLPQTKKHSFLTYAAALSTMIVTHSAAQSQKMAGTSSHIVTENKKPVQFEQPYHHQTLEKQDNELIFKGTVQTIDSANGRTSAIGWASVIIKGTRTGVACNETGEFKLPYTPSTDSGTIILLISCMGFEVKEIAVSFNKLSDCNLGAITMEKYKGTMTEYYVFAAKRKWYKNLWYKATKLFRKKRKLKSP